VTVKAAFIGSGGIASHHMKQIKQNRGYSIVAACDIAEDRVQKFCQDFEIPRHYTDMNKMLENEQLDAVLVCTPNYAHAAPTIAALKAGIHVYCEKPMAMNVAEGRKMLKAAQDSKATLTIGHHQRFEPASQFLHKERLAGTFGDIYFARAVMHRRGFVPWWGAFHIKAKSGGGALIDIGCHIIDLTLWLMGSPNPVEVTGVATAKLATRTDGSRPNQNKEKAHEFDVDDFATAYVRMDNGASLAVECSWACNSAVGRLVELYGDEGGATIQPLTIYTQRHGQFVDIHPGKLPEVQPHGAATEHFRRVILGEAENLVKPEETLNVQKILDGIYKSTTTGKAVRIAD